MKKSAVLTALALCTLALSACNISESADSKTDSTKTEQTEAKLKTVKDAKANQIFVKLGSDTKEVFAKENEQSINQETIDKITKDLVEFNSPTDKQSQAGSYYVANLFNITSTVKAGTQLTEKDGVYSGKVIIQYSTLNPGVSLATPKDYTETRDISVKSTNDESDKDAVYSAMIDALKAVQYTKVDLSDDEMQMQSIHGTINGVDSKVSDKVELLTYRQVDLITKDREKQVNALNAKGYTVKPSDKTKTINYPIKGGKQWQYDILRNVKNPKLFVVDNATGRVVGVLLEGSKSPIKSITNEKDQKLKLVLDENVAKQFNNSRYQLVVY